MKVVLCLVLSFLVFIGLSLWNQYYLNKTSRQMAKQVEQLRLTVLSDDWAQADKRIQQVRKSWGNNKKIWLMLLDHQDIDNIDLAIFQIDELIKQREKTDSLSAIAQLRFHILDITDKERFEAGNIF